MNQWLNNQRGSEKIYSIIGFAVIIIVVFLAFKLGVPYFKHMSLSQYAQELVNYDYQNERPNPSTVNSIQGKLVSRIKQKKLPIDSKAIKVDYDLEKYRVQITYTYPVNLLVTRFDWQFTIEKESERY
ncbi:MAG TPA: hypothetical protein PLV45_19110 [bacterium]|nr:hypothetical protein [bacterium]